MTAHFSLAEMVQATGGQIRQPGARSRFVGLSTDSRTAQTGQIYLPLAGERFDGHDFIDQAVRRGVGAVVAAAGRERAKPLSLPAEVSLVVVPDTLQALGDLANFWRRRFSLPVVAITGSCGKTTTKEMIAQVLTPFLKVLKNDLNLNNLIGMPQTLLQLSREHDVAVVEMGMNRFGEIRRLSRIAQPTIAVLTNVHPAHLEGLGSIQGVARAKSEIMEGLHPRGTVIYNFDDLLLREALRSWPGRALGFGFAAGAQVRATATGCCGLWGQKATITWNGTTWEQEIPQPGPHQISNALAATAVGLTLGLRPTEISQALSRFQSLDKRCQLQAHDSGLVIFNDCYNANPGSMAMALRTLAALKNSGRTVAALGDMLELGETTIQAHKDLGSLAAQMGVDLLVVCGNFRTAVREGALAGGLPDGRVHTVASHAEGANIIKEFCRPGDLLLVKGSRGARMEKLLACL